MGKSILYSLHIIMKRYRSEMHGCTALTGVWNECIHPCTVVASQMGTILKGGPKHKKQFHWKQ